MSLTFPKPDLLKPRIPALLVAGLLAGQYLLFGPGSSHEPQCILKVDRPHLSTYLSEQKNLDAIKINIESKCNSAQNFTELNIRIDTVDGKRQYVAFTFGTKTKGPAESAPNRVAFKNLFANCTKGKSALYSGYAKGLVHLKNGVVLPVSGTSDKFTSVPCRIGAK